MSVAYASRVTTNRPRAWAIAVYSATSAWALVAFAVVRYDFLRFQLAYYDLGNMTQAVWSTTNGRPLESTLSTGEQGVRFGGHVDPVLVLFAPLWVVFPTPLLLAGAQVVAVASGTLPVYWLARRHLDSEPASALLALSYLAYPWIAWTALDAFHPVTLAVPALLFGIYFLDSDRLGAFAALAVLALTTNELVGIFVAGLGIWYWLARGRRAGLAIAAGGIAWTTACVLVVIPAFSDEGNRFYSHYDHVGGSATGIARTLFTDPGAIVDAVTSTPDLAYLPWLVVPLLGAPLLAPGLALLVLPQVGVNLLADLGSTTDPRHHYVAGVIPFLFAAAAIGLARLPARLLVPVTAGILALNVVLSIALGPWPGLPGPRSAFHEQLTDRHSAALRDAVSLVPGRDPVSTTNVAGSHLAARQYVFQVPVVRHARWIVLDSSDDYMGIAGVLREGRHPERLRAFHQRIRRSAEWDEAFAREGVFVYRRVVSP